MPENDGRRWYLSLITEGTKRFANEFFESDVEECTVRIKCDDGLKRELYECSLEDVSYFLNWKFHSKTTESLIFCVFVSFSNGRPKRVRSVEEGLLVKNEGLPEKKSVIRVWWDFLTSPMP
jgi:hypothetical protein